MLRLQSKITFTSKKTSEVVVFDFVHEVKTSSSFEDLTQTAEITIPRNVVFNGKPIAVGLNSIFKRGDKVKIELGYFPELKTIFTGYISEVRNATPLQLMCEDEMFILKQKKINTYTKKSISLKQFLIDIVGDSVPVNRLIEIQNIGEYRFSNIDAAKALDIIKKEVGAYSYFVDGVLNVGLAENAKDTLTKEFKFEETVIDETNLEYKREDDVLLKVKGVSIFNNNTKIEYETGDSEGTQKTFFAFGINKAELKTFTDSKLKNFKYEGYRGTFETFGEPVIRPGDNAKLTSLKYPEKNGTYQVISVNRNFGMNGYRQNVQLGIKVA